MLRNKEQRSKLLFNSSLGFKILCPFKKEGNVPCINLPCPPPPILPGSQDSEVSEEQKREKILELKKKEKLLQEKLLKKVEELKKICMREAVSVFLFRVRDAFQIGFDSSGQCQLSPYYLVMFSRNSPAKYQRSIP